MPRNLTISAFYPSHHPLANTPTLFVEKILLSLAPQETYFMAHCEKCGWMGTSLCCNGGHQIADTGDYTDPECPLCGSPYIDGECQDMGYYKENPLVFPKGHTIRAGNNWSVGDKMFPFLWALPGGRFTKGNKKIQIAPAVTVKKIWTVERSGFNDWFIGKKFVDYNLLCKLSRNDGFPNNAYFQDWFNNNKNFKGQILCWDEKIEY